MFRMIWKFGGQSRRDPLGSSRAQALQVSSPVQGKEVEVPAVHSNSSVSDLASASEAASVDMAEAGSAGSFAAGSAGAPGVAFVDTSEVANAGILAVAGEHWG